METSNVTTQTKQFVDNVYKQTHYNSSLEAEAEQIYHKLIAFIPAICQSGDGQKLVQKYIMLGRTVRTEGMFQDMVKIIWRMVKEIPAQNSVHRLGLFVIAINAMGESLPVKEQLGAWQLRLEKWLGNQLTIGGKGCTGDGEGSVTDRIQRFFNTPYLHDFD